MMAIMTPEEAESALNSLKIGEETFFSYNPKWKITRVMGGFLYSSDYNGVTFVPDVPKKQPAQKPLFEEQKIEKPVKKAVVK